MSLSALELRIWLVDRLAARLEVAASAIDGSRPFASYGLDSAGVLDLTGELEAVLGRTLSHTLFWDHPNIEALALHLSGEGSARASPPTSVAPRLPPRGSEPIAIVGMSCRFPRANGLAAYWKLLSEGVDAITEVPRDRWNIDELYDSNAAAPGKMVTRWGGFIDGIADFDRSFFKISHREANHLDPQQRMLLELAWEAFEDAGVSPLAIAGAPVGVFVGISTADYLDRLKQAHAHDVPYASTGNAFSVAANRISYEMDLRGPSMAIDTACSSSLSAIQLACDNLRSGSSTMALAGGVNAILSPHVTINFSKAGFMAPDGRCKAFDSRANGYVRGEGGALVVLKPLSAALSDGDRIWAVIRGGAMNQDGRSNGLTAPNGVAQENVLRAAYLNAGVAPSEVDYVECHGTGTALGDPIELRALGAVLGENRPGDSKCAVGSVKTNFGHLEAAAGVASVIKVALALAHGQIPPSLHFEKPNPHIPFSKLPVVVQSQLGPWPNEPHRIAGVSGFGFGGTNVHLVLEASPRQPSESLRATAPAPMTLPLSARSAEALVPLALAYRKLLEVATPEEAERTCASAGRRRGHFLYRASAVAASQSELVNQLAAFVEGGRAPGLTVRSHASTAPAPMVWVFSGQGPQWWGMGRELFEHEPVFRARVEECSAALRRYSGWSLVSELAVTEERSRLAKTEVAQPAIVALQLGLAALLRSWGLEPDAVIGHSVGELSAAHVAGALSLAETMRLVFFRGNSMRSVEGKGQMLAVSAMAQDVEPFFIGPCAKLSISALNSPKAVVVAGEPEAIAHLKGELTATGIETRPMPMAYAFHSSMMDSVRHSFSETVKDIEARSPALALYSTLTGERHESVMNSAYWGEQLRAPVRFSPAIGRLLDAGFRHFLELSAHPVLSGYIGQCGLAADVAVDTIQTLRRNEPERLMMQRALGRAYALGKDIDWRNVNPQVTGVAQLPTYPWKKERCWIDEPLSGGASAAVLETPKPSAPALRETLTHLPPPLREESLIALLLERLSKSLGVTARTINPDTPLIQLGIDSFMAIELKNHAEAELAVGVPMAMLLEGASTRQLAHWLSQRVKSTPASTPDDRTASPTVAAELLRNIEHLTDAQVEALLVEVEKHGEDS